MEQPPLKNLIEALLLSAGRPLTLTQLLALLIDEPVADEEEGAEAAAEGEAAAKAEAEAGTPRESDESEESEENRTRRDELREALAELAADYEGRAFELKEVASGWRIQVRHGYAPWVSRLWEERPARYSRALLETLALIAYRQPITRAEIEDIRGVAVSSNIVKTLLEREWIRVVGHRDVPGRPAMYATTRQFLDYFNLKSLAELPTLAELRDLEQISAELVEQGVIEPEPEPPPKAEGEESAGTEASAAEETAAEPVSDESGEVDDRALEEIAEAASADDEESEEQGGVAALPVADEDDELYKGGEETAPEDGA